MHFRKHHPVGISAIIPAYNEADQIMSVISVVEKHPLISEVIVVSDGSTDETAARARKSSATVIELTDNVGKGKAMSIAVEAAKNEVILFVDADVVGLTEDMITALVSTVLSGRYDMFTLVRDRASEKFQLLSPTWVVGGERVLTKKLWNLVPEEDREGFQIEIALNYYAKEHGYRADCALAPGLTQVIKEKKHGFWRGLFLRIHEWMQCLRIFFKLHVFRMAKS